MNSTFASSIPRRIDYLAPDPSNQGDKGSFLSKLLSKVSRRARKQSITPEKYPYLYGKGSLTVFRGVRVGISELSSAGAALGFDETRDGVDTVRLKEVEESLDKAGISDLMLRQLSQFGTGTKARLTLAMSKDISDSVRYSRFVMGENRPVLGMVAEVRINRSQTPVLDWSDPREIGLFFKPETTQVRWLLVTDVPVPAVYFVRDLTALQRAAQGEALQPTSNGHLSVSTLKTLVELGVAVYDKNLSVRYQIQSAYLDFYNQVSRFTSTSTKIRKPLETGDVEEIVAALRQFESTLTTLRTDLGEDSGEFLRALLDFHIFLTKLCGKLDLTQEHSRNLSDEMSKVTFMLSNLSQVQPD